MLKVKNISATNASALQLNFSDANFYKSRKHIFDYAFLDPRASPYFMAVCHHSYLYGGRVCANRTANTKGTSARDGNTVAVICATRKDGTA